MREKTNARFSLQTAGKKTLAILNCRWGIILRGLPETLCPTVKTWLREQETSWYMEGMHSIVSCWRKAVDVNGDYVEK
jgi:hypothetical protein